MSALDRDSVMVVHPVKTSETFANDCIVKALNFMLRSYYFTHQLQVLRLAVRNLKVSKAEVDNLKLAGGIRANAFFEEFLIKEDNAYRLCRVMLDVEGIKQRFYSGNELWKFIRDFVKVNMLPVNKFKFHEILVTTIGHSNDGSMYSHAGAFVRREVPARNKSGRKAEVYYYDGNLNHMCAIGAATIAAEPMDFEKVFRQYDALKIYALSARKLRKVTEEDKMKLTHQHWKLGRHFLERPDEVRYEDFVHYLQQKGAEMTHQVKTWKARVEGHGRPHLTKAQRTAKKNPKRAASAQLMPNDLIAAVASERNVGSTPRATETFQSNMVDGDEEME